MIRLIVCWALFSVFLVGAAELSRHGQTMAAFAAIIPASVFYFEMCRCLK